MTDASCATCNVPLTGSAGLSYCSVEETCLTHCTAFVQHVTEAGPDPLEDRGGYLDDIDRAYDAAVDDALNDAIAAGEPENWKAYLGGGR